MRYTDPSGHAICDEDETYIPNIIAYDPKSGEVIFVEVERDVSKDQLSRKTKWMKFYEAPNENLYVFWDNLNCQRSIQGFKWINLQLFPDESPRITKWEARRKGWKYLVFSKKMK